MSKGRVVTIDDSCRPVTEGFLSIPPRACFCTTAARDAEIRRDALSTVLSRLESAPDDLNKTGALQIVRALAEKG